MPCDFIFRTLLTDFLRSTKHFGRNLKIHFKVSALVGYLWHINKNSPTTLSTGDSLSSPLLLIGDCSTTHLALPPAAYLFSRDSSTTSASCPPPLIAGFHHCSGESTSYPCPSSKFYLLLLSSSLQFLSFRFVVINNFCFLFNSTLDLFFVLWSIVTYFILLAYPTLCFRFHAHLCLPCPCYPFLNSDIFLVSSIVLVIDFWLSTFAVQYIGCTVLSFRVFVSSS